MGKTSLPPLGKLLNTIESLGYKVSHQYNDLVFVDNTAFLFRFGREDETIYLHFNIECNEDFKNALSTKAIEVAKIEGIKALKTAADYAIEQEEDQEQIKIRFTD